MTGINHSAPSPIVVPAAATFAYDAAGNRTSMTDGPGTATYQYDQLSRLSSESRSLNDLPNAPVPNNDYTIAYGYNLAGKVTSITDPFGSQISYTHDAAGRLNSITRPASPGAPGIPNTMSNIQYRAFGKLKQGTIGWNGNTSTILYTHDAKMEVNRFQVSSATAGTHGAQYQRYNDGRVSYVQDLSDPEFDRLYSYDLMGRVTQGLTGQRPETPHRPTVLTSKCIVTTRLVISPAAQGDIGRKTSRHKPTLSQITATHNGPTMQTVE